MKLKTFLFLPILIAAVIYAGLKGYIHFRVKGKIDDLQKMMAPFATLSYSNIASDLRGKLTVSDIAVIPAGTTLEFRVKELEIAGPDLGFLLALSGDFRNSEAPDSMRLHLKQARLPSDEDFMSQLSSLVPLSADQANKARPPEVCSLGGIFQHIGMEKIGYGTPLVDFSMSYEYYRPADELTVTTQYNRPGLESFEWTMVFENMPQMNQVMMGDAPELKKMEGSYRVDKAYMKRMVDYCATQAETNPQRFVEGLFNQPDGYYARNIGIVPGLGIRAAMKSLLTGATELGFSAYPLAEITSEMFSTYPPEELVSVLGLQVSIDGKRIPDISFTVPEDLSIYADGSSEDQFSQLTEAELRARRKPRRFIKTDLADLENYLGANIHLYIKNEDKMRVGVLDDIDDVYLDVQQRVSGGTFTAHIPIDTIESVEVLRTVK